jgi:Fe2+ transport system protein FeoA
MIAQSFPCPLCGHQYNPADHAACRTCPLNKSCSLVCCPACGHTTIDPARSRLAQWLTMLLPKQHQATAEQPGRAARSAAAGDARLWQNLSEVAVGSTARVLGFADRAAAYRERLQAYGIAPGRSIRVVQQLPVTVIQVDHTELAFEIELARGILIETIA